MSEPPASAGGLCKAGVANARATRLLRPRQVRLGIRLDF